jgi:hypothetical protein
MKRGHCCIGLPLQKPGLASCEVAQPTWAFQPMGPKQGTRSSSSHRLFTSEIRLAGDGSSGKVLLGRKPWWRGTQFGVLDGEGPNSDSPGSSSRGRLGSWLGLRSTVARGTRLGCSSAMAYRCIAAAEQRWSAGESRAKQGARAAGGGSEMVEESSAYPRVR